MNRSVDEPIHVLLVNPVGVLGGAERVFLGLIRHLPEFGVRCSLALMRPGPLEASVRDEFGIPVHVFPEDFRYRDFGALWRATRWLEGIARSSGADLLHSNHMAHLHGRHAARRAGMREVWHLHDYPYTRDMMESLCYRIPASFVVFTTEKVRSGFPRVAQRTPNAVVHPTCVEVAELRARPRDPEVRQRIGIGDGPFFATVTRLQGHKGHPDLIAAAAIVHKTHPEARWVIVGEPRGAEQEAYVRDLRQQVEAAGLQERVLFTGFISDADVTSLLSEAVALVHPATTEQFGLVLIEAMATGAPVIAAAADGPAELIQDGENGLLVPTRDPAALAAAMQRLLAEPELRERLRAGGAAFADRQSVRAMTEATAAVYRRVLSK